MASDGVSKYGVSDIEYDIVTTLANTLQAQETLDKYAADAEAANDKESATLFRTMKDSNRNYAEQLRGALARHISGGQ